MKRRTVLAGLGLGVGAAFVPRAPRAVRAAPASRPARLFILYIPHGLPWEHFDPVGPGGGLDFAASGIGGFSPLEPYRDAVTVLRGVSMANGAKDHMAIRAALTGFPEGGVADSIDYTIAQALGVTPHVLGAFPYDPGAGFTEDSHLARHGGAWVRALESPLAAADQIFGAVGPPALDEAPFEAEALALAQRQVARLRARVAGLDAEASKLDVHLRALQDVARSRAAPLSACPGRPAMPAVDALAGIDPLDATHFGHVFDAHLEVAASALFCGAARVVTLQTMFARAGVRFDFLDGPGIPADHHLGLSHVVEPREPYARAQQWLISRLATKVLSVLDQPDPLDPAHTVLDNTVVYVTSEISDGSVHNSDTEPVTIVDRQVYSYLPQLLIGGGAGNLRPGGRVVQVEENRPHTDVLATIAGAMGVPLTRLAGESVSEIDEVKA